MDIQIGKIETGVEMPRIRAKPLTAAQQRVLELPVGGSFVITASIDENDEHELNHAYRSFQSEAPRLQNWARTRGIKVSCRQIARDERSLSLRVWRVS